MTDPTDGGGGGRASTASTATAAPPGLSSAEAARRLAECGPNVVERGRRASPLRSVGHQLLDTMILVLLAAAVLTAVIGEVGDLAVILLVVVVNSAIGAGQEIRAERAMEALAALAAPTAKVYRDGALRVLAAADVAPGDLVVVEAGDVVPADARAVDGQGAQVDESVLTGESLPVDRRPRRGGDGGDSQVDVLHAGTVVRRGRLVAEVSATGPASAIGQLARTVGATAAPRTPLQQRLGRLGQQIAVGAVAVCLLVAVLGVLRGQDPELMALTAVSLAVAAIPESLPAVVALSLALGAQRMARHHAIVRHLPAVETLGSVTLVASDKTGTLTQGVMRPAAAWTPSAGAELLGSVDGAAGDAEPVGRSSPALRRLAEACVLCNDAPTGATADRGSAADPTEVGLLELAELAGVDVAAVRAAFPRQAELAFDADLQRMTTVHEDVTGRADGSSGVLVVCKGSPERVLAPDGPLAAGQERAVAQARERAGQLAARGDRVLAVAAARRAGPHPPASGAVDADAAAQEHRLRLELERDLELLGLVALADPPRPAARAAVAACRAAGIRPVMITGDHPHTAAAVAEEVGVLDPTTAVLPGAVLTGPELETSDSPSEIERAHVFARTRPEQKLRLVEQWRADGEVVAMTGDGVNDAPALRSAHIGVAMGRSGTDVAREAADMVLVDDDFATIVGAVGEGRRVYANIRRFVLYGLAGGTTEVLVMLLGPFLGFVVPLLPAQILWVNLLTHGLPGVAMGMEPLEPGAMRRPPRPPAQPVLGGGLWQRLVALAVLFTVACLGVAVWADRTGHAWRTMLFVVLGMLQLVSALSLRSPTRPVWHGLGANPFLLSAVLVNAVLLGVAVWWPPLQSVFGTHPLDTSEAVAVGVVVLGVLVLMESAKAVRRRRTVHRP
ncbi:MAG TPA: cation-transporting P-type ATPase [Motilibacteraceae bacterium]|nr:cation-transporting P-type ATPase [Motilibacteraceae bacterium]